MILGSVCCRGGSKGVPGKNLRTILGKPLLLYTIETAQACPSLNDLIISTDSEDIAAVGRSAGVKIPFMRSAELASDTASKWHVFRDAVERYEAATGNTVTYLVDMDVTVPLKKSSDIEGAIALALKNPLTDVVITGYDPERNPYFNMMELKENGYAEIVKKPAKPLVRRQDAPKVYSLTPAAFVVKREALYDYPHWSEAKCKIFEMPRERAIDIDTEVDFKIVEYFINHPKH